MKRPRSLFKYYDERRWADAFLVGSLRFQTLSRFRSWEEQEVRGDRHEGVSLFAPDAGLQISNKTQGTEFMRPDHRLASTARHAEVLVFCMSRTLSPRLWDGFRAVACVEIVDIPAFCARVMAGLPAGARLGGRPGRERIGRRVEYYQPADPVGPRWALPDRIACSKLDAYAWQDEFRLVFSMTDALEFQNVSMALAARDAEPPPNTEQGEPQDIAVSGLEDICRLHTCRPAAESHGAIRLGSGSGTRGTSPRG